MKTKTYTIRYYIPRVGADGKRGTVAATLDKVATMPEGVGLVREAGSMVHQVRIHNINAEKTEYRAAFVRFRDELPLVGKRSSSTETPPKLDDDDEIIEKNHFTLFVDESGVEVIAYQVSMEGSDVAALARYFTFAGGGEHNVSFDEVLTGDALEKMKKGILKAVEFEIAKPRKKTYAPDPNDTWTSEAMQFMSSTGATRFRAKIMTTSKQKGLLANIKDQIGLLLQSTQTKKLKVKLSEVDHPIDLFADRVFDKVTIELHQGRPDSTQMFTEIATVKKANTGLEPYLVKGNEALD
ncbi:DUF6731 family protein [Chromobacterium sp. TRC.1.1.SA]|uniref:DUF6731 family protein n=1 Tax=Chromobacterium indicum TaxID=3110228 RepID=A0ABV0CHP1_9NEIS